VALFVGQAQAGRSFSKYARPSFRGISGRPSELSNRKVAYDLKVTYGGALADSLLFLDCSPDVRGWVANTHGRTKVARVSAGGSFSNMPIKRASPGQTWIDCRILATPRWNRLPRPE